MNRFARFRCAGLIGLAALLLFACGGSPVAPSPAPGPQQILGATEIVRFDPTAIPLGNDQPVSGTCVASTIIPGAYRCDLATGGAAEPCFALGGTRLVCGPNPAVATYQMQVSPSGPLPSVSAPPIESQVEFFVELAGGQTCLVRTGPEPVILNGAPALYDCDTPYTYLIALDRETPTWTATLATLDPATGQTTAATPATVVRAWVP